jgi:ribosome-binding protein aMBF1 (putative translation factor)
MSQKKYIPNQKLREARELRGWSQEDVAEQLGEFVDKSTISRWERGVAIPRPIRTNLRTEGPVRRATPEELG